VDHATDQLARLSNQIVDCRAFLAARGGHPLMWSAPQDFRAISDYFLRSVESRKDGKREFG
jgi:hypothetical protein